MSWTNPEQRLQNRQAYSLSKWISLLFFFLCIAVFFYVYFRSGSINNTIYFKYFLLSIGGALFWLVVFTLRKEFQENIQLSFITIIMTMYLIEGVLTFYGFGEPFNRSKTLMKLGFEYDQRTKLEVVKDLREDGLNAVPSFHPNSQWLVRLKNKVQFNKKKLNTLFPLGGVANNITVYSHELEKYLIYKSDRYGFNNPDNEWDSKSIDWLLIGDSFLHGSGALPGQEIASKIRDYTNNSVINLGIGGNGPLLEYATLREYGIELKPKKVLWFYYEGNDFENLKQEIRSPILMQYLSDNFSQDLISRQSEVDSVLNEYIDSEFQRAERDELVENVINQSNWIRLYRIRKLLDIDEVDFDISILAPSFFEILNKAKKLVESWDGELYFVYLPEHSRYSKKVISHSQYKSKSDLIDMVNDLKIPVIDIHREVFSHQDNPLLLFPFGLPGHYNAAGYDKVSKAILTNMNKYKKSVK